MAEKVEALGAGRGRSRFSREAWRHRAFALAMAALGLVYFHGLAEGDLKDWDESVYALRALAAYEHGGAVWLDQEPYSWLGYYSAAFPPALVWSSAAMFRLMGGPSEFAHRFCTALVGASGLLALALLGERLRGKLAGALSALALLSILFYTQYARRGQFDVWFIAFDWWAFLFYVRAQAAESSRRRRRELLLCGLALGVSAMSKIVIGVVVFVGVVAAFAPWRIARGRSTWRAFAAEVGWVGAAALAVWSPWHVYMTFAGGWDFWNHYIGFHVLMRGTQVVDHHQHEFLYYFKAAGEHVSEPVLVAAALGCATGAGLGLRELWRAARKLAGQPGGAVEQSAEALPWKAVDFAGSHAFAALALLFPLALYTLARTKRDTYFLPLAPPLALCAGLFAADFAKGKFGALWRWLALWAVIACAIWSRSKSAQGNIQLFLSDPGSPPPLSARGLEFMAHYVGPSIAGGLGAAALLAGLAGAWSRFSGKGTAKRAFRLAAGTVLLGVVAVFALRDAKTALDAGRGRRHFGWQGMLPLIQERGEYGSIVFLSSYHEPAKCFYLYGADPNGWVGARSLGIVECRQSPDPDIARAWIEEADNPLILMDWYTVDRLPPDQNAKAWQLAAELEKIRVSGSLVAFAKPGSRLAR